MLPATLALIDDDDEYSEYLVRHLSQRGVRVQRFADGDEFLTAPDAYDHEFYIVDLALPGIDGMDILRLIRRKGPAGIIVVSGRGGAEVFDAVLRAGADMYVMKPVRMEQVALAIEAVNRRIEGARTLTPVWRLDRAARKLVAPDGTRIELSDNDRALMECFVAAEGATVTRATLRERLSTDAADEDANLLHAAIYRLRRRIEKATPAAAPLQAEQKVGYTFKARLLAV